MLPSSNLDAAHGVSWPRGWDVLVRWPGEVAFLVAVGTRPVLLPAVQAPLPLLPAQVAAQPSHWRRPPLVRIATTLRFAARFRNLLLVRGVGLHGGSDDPLQRDALVGVHGAERAPATARRPGGGQQARTQGRGTSPLRRLGPFARALTDTWGAPPPPRRDPGGGSSSRVSDLGETRGAGAGGRTLAAWVPERFSRWRRMVVPLPAREAEITEGTCHANPPLPAGVAIADGF